MADEPPSDSDPRAVRSLAVTTEDVVAAYEARQRSRRRPVLRATPPFSGRMRARLHDPGSTGAESGSDSGSDSDVDVDSGSDSAADLDPETGALHVPPSRFVDEHAVPAYPSPDDTEDALREDPGEEFTVERHRERHVAAVEAWRESVRDVVVDSLELRTSDGAHRVAVKTLGGSRDA